MFAAGPNALLCVGHARRTPLRFFLSKKNRHELVHADIREKQIRSVGQKRRRRHNGVLFLAKEIEKRLPDLRRSHQPEIKRDISRDARTTAVRFGVSTGGGMIEMAFGCSVCGGGGN